MDTTSITTIYRTSDGLEFDSFVKASDHASTLEVFHTMEKCQPKAYSLMLVETEVEDTFDKKIKAIADVRSVFYCSLHSAKDFVVHAIGESRDYPKGYRKATFKMNRFQYEALLRTGSFTNNIGWNSDTQIYIRMIESAE